MSFRHTEVHPLDERRLALRESAVRLDAVVPTDTKRRVKMRPVAALVAACVLVILGTASLASADEMTSVGGDLKFYLYDESAGEVEIADMEMRDDTVEQSNNISAGLSSAIITLHRDLSDDVSVELEPEIMVHAGATPRLGDEITRATEAEIEIEFLRANVTWRLPSGFELKAGYLKPLFTWDYGYELFWNEQYNASVVSANPWLGAWHDGGVELYKTLETDEFSVPVYLYVLNGPGQGETDNNEGKSVMVHVAPEFLMGRLKVLGSYGMGKWDNGNEYNMTRYAAGVNVNVAGFMVRGEYIGGTWEKAFHDRDIEPMGYYVKAFYRIMPDLRAFAGWSHLEHDFSGFFFAAADMEEVYDQYIFGADYFLADGVSVMLTYEMTEADRTEPDDSTGGIPSYAEPAKLDYHRINLGARVTF